MHRIKRILRSYAALLLTVVVAYAPGLQAEDGFRSQSYAIEGRGFVTDASHPMRPGDFAKIDVRVRLVVDPETREAQIEFTSSDEGTETVERYLVRQGRIFTRDEQGQSIEARSFGDLSPANVAAIHSSLVADAIAERSENYRESRQHPALLAWNDELWEVERRAGALRQLHRNIAHELFGDGDETLAYVPAADGTEHVTIARYDRDVAKIEFDAPTQASATATSRDRQADRNHVISSAEIAFTPIADDIYTLDLQSLNMRVTVAEFADYMVVYEGAYSSAVCDRIARHIRDRFNKPVRYFGFSHLHGQYVGGVRSWIAEGATVLVPPSTVPLIETIASARQQLRPDALSKTPKKLSLETVAKRRRIDDEANAVDVYQIESGHTDEYLIFHFPRQRVLLTGDLLGYRPGQPLSARGKKLCGTIEALGLNVEKYVATWPLDGYGTKNIVSGEEMSKACSISE